MSGQYKIGATKTRPNGERYVFNGQGWAQMHAPKIDKDEDAEVAKLSNEAHNKRVLADASHDFMRMNENTATGPGFAPVGFSLPHWLGGEHINLNPTHALATNPASFAYNPDIKAMEAITGRFAPQLRPVGSGRLMQTELDAFKKALPSITNGGEDNRRLAQQYETEAQRATSEVTFKRNWLHATGTLAGADEAFDRLNAHPANAPMVGTPMRAATQEAKGAHEMSDAELMKAAGLQ